MANRLSCRKSEDIANGSDYRTQMLSLPFLRERSAWPAGQTLPEQKAQSLTIILEHANVNAVKQRRCVKTQRLFFKKERMMACVIGVSFCQRGRCAFLR